MPKIEIWTTEICVKFHLVAEIFYVEESIYGWKLVEKLLHPKEQTEKCYILNIWIPKSEILKL